jgi:hypothetical protein
VAAVVGFVLVLAVLITYLAYVAGADVPRWGAEAERSWDQTVGDSLTKLDRSAAAGLGTQAATTVSIPAAPAPRAFDVPLVSRTQPAAPTGSVAFEPACAKLTALHAASGTTVSDIKDGAQGCVYFHEQGTYSASYGYRTEFGGLLRVERSLGYVVAGPPLDLKVSGGRYFVSATFLDMRGPSNAAAVGSGGTAVDLTAGPSLTESGQALNAASANWTFDTPYPAAWKTWFDGQLAQAGFDPALNYACLAGDARCPDLQPNEFRVVLNGPTASPSASDVALSISYGRYDVTIR